MTVSNLATRPIRAAVVVLAVALSLVALVLSAGAAGATTRPAVTVRAGGISQPFGCPQTTTLSARILSNGPAFVRYHWLRSDGAVTRQQTLRFRGPGRHVFDVHTEWQVSDTSTRWEQLVVTSPDRVSTHRIYFSTECATQILGGWATATDSSALCDDVYTDLGGVVFLWGTPPSSVRYYWTVDGTAVGAGIETDPTTLASGGVRPTFHYAFIAARGTTDHTVALHAESTDGSLSWASPTTYFTTTCV